ncbi:DUF7114 family protein [Halococcus sp. AFM35]|uniref:DUF7114 family protein n=1 Tax=Halococcus sp. AFM35 TaxID=3421653 RepID=UPI003EB8AB53
MEEASHVRSAAREAVRDIDPEPFNDAVTAALETGSMAPGVLVVLSARALDSSIGFETVAKRAAGTQLIYEGLRLTRRLAAEVPWETDESDEANVAVLAADALVARGFYLLARTDAAGSAVETVRNFGRDRTRGRDKCRLEADVFRLAAVAGTTAVDGHPSTNYREFVADLATAESTDLPAAEALFDAATRDALARRASAPFESTDAGARTSATDS